MKLRDVSASVWECDGGLKVSVSFKIPGRIERVEFPPGNIRPSENERKRIQKEIQKFIERMEWKATEELVEP
jgi:hypothetical protein